MVQLFCRDRTKADLFRCKSALNMSDLGFGNTFELFMESVNGTREQDSGGLGLGQSISALVRAVPRSLGCHSVFRIAASDWSFDRVRKNNGDETKMRVAAVSDVEGSMIQWQGSSRAIAEFDWSSDLKYFGFCQWPHQLTLACQYKGQDLASAVLHV